MQLEDLCSEHLQEGENKMLISVIIPCYNSGKYIEKCLNALDRQTFKDFDIILVDDCSIDNTLEVVNNYSKKHDLNITILSNKVNSVPAVSRLNGIKKSKSEFIAFCDSDDWYDSNYLDVMSRAITSNDSDMIFCNSQKVFGNGTIKKINNTCGYEGEITQIEALTMGIDSLWSIVVRKAIFESVAQTDLRNGEDMAIIPLMIMESRKFYAVKEYLYNYLCRPGSLSLNCNDRMISSLELSFEHILVNAKPGFEKEVEYIGIKNVVYGILLNHFKYSSNKTYARNLLKKFEDQYPCWSKNVYIRNMSLFKRLFVWLAKKRCFAGIKILCGIHRFLVEKTK